MNLPLRYIGAYGSFIVRGWILVAIALGLSSAYASNIDLLLDVPLGNGSSESTCSAMAVSDSGDTYLICQSIGESSSSLWFSYLSGDSHTLSTIPVQIPLVELSRKREAARDLLLHEESIFLLLEWKKSGSRRPSSSLAIAKLDISGNVYDSHPIPFSLQNTRMAFIDSHEFLVIGQNTMPFGDNARALEAYRIEYSDITQYRKIPLSYQLKNGESLVDVIAVDSDTLILLTESSILAGPAQMKLLQISLSTDTLKELDVVSGGSCRLMKYGDEIVTLSYRAPNKEWSHGKMGDWLGEGHARMYSLPSMKLLYDVSLTCAIGSNSNGSIPVFSINDSNQLVGALVTTNGSLGSCRILSPKTIFRLKRQSCINETQYLLADEIEQITDPEQPSKSILRKRTRLLIAHPSSSEQE